MMSRIWVADTCALLDVRRSVVPSDTRQTHSARKQVFKRLEELVNAGRLVFPHETYNELKEGNAQLDDAAQDHPFHFVERCKKIALRAANLEIVKELGAHALVRRVVDPNAEKDEADIYVLSVAVELQRAGREVGVLTQERKDLATKLSMNTALWSSWPRLPPDAGIPAPGRHLDLLEVGACHQVREIAVPCGA
jgi:hypothetical protein